MELDAVGLGTLKLVSAWSPRRPLHALIEAALREHIDEFDIRFLFGRNFLVHSDAEPTTIRDWLAAHLEEGESAFVVEFERWSSWGESADRVWLNRRGH